MNRRRLILIGTLFLVAALLAILMQDMIQKTIIVPLTYLWWVGNLIYRSIAQLVLWTLLIVGVALIAFGSLYGEFKFRRNLKKNFVPERGPVESLAGWIQQASHGTYFKWRVAHRLGELARAILTQRERLDTLTTIPESLTDRDWNPPRAIQHYLESGLIHSFAEYPRQGFLSRPSSTPFDLGINEVVSYLETQMETNSDHRHS